MKILVTGASGFIGSNIVESLAAYETNDIWATGRSFTLKFDHFENVTYFQLDLSEGLPDLIFDVCIHCAGLADDKATREQFNKHNVKATENLLRALRGCKTFIFISSASVYDYADGKVKYEEDAHLDNDLSLYGHSKLLAEDLVRASGICSVYILRPRAVYGRGDRVLLPRILGLIRRGRMILPANVTGKASMTHVQNLAEVVQKCIGQSAAGIHVFNVADKRIYDLREIFGAILQRKFGKKRFFYIPGSVVVFFVFLGSYLRGAGRLSRQSLKYITEDSVIDVGKVEKLVGYKGQHEFFNSVADLDI
ncbi:NAD(P)-dependent oxidoreductase [Dyadobacter sp. CY312]|uniref:NAD-dependent epimerase/dehydratase family protein n=1 Tax=Dyadobacter sp. CY312 TaxID=2907303 RepID=UPI001F43EA87|nr:NAD-dependent epimerase/dehydratase family protein [Dyadobacter sp. CY312]MCE7040217.1 NAD-dependent epimerase/dehydratase family protein [Dyadobacter sp. CY312]